MRTIYAQEGIIGFFKGFWWSFLSVSFARMLFFTGYEMSKNMYAKHAPDGVATKKHIAMASFQTSILAQFITTPFWVVKTRLLLNTNKRISVRRAGLS
jgi:solute carrier family 25 folate transporter 32